MLKIYSVIFLLILTSCSPIYIMRSAYQQGKILANREDIEDVIRNPESDQSLKQKLETVVAARAYAIKIGLQPKNSFTKYSKVDSDVLAWILMGSKPDSFELYNWWFPIVGTVPYKGYFDAKDAERAAENLQKKGYETRVRGTEAFSTLGWFNDPILSTTLKHGHVTIATTVIHESVHTTYWLPGHVDFNESLANFIGTIAACDFFREQLTKCENPTCKESNNILISECEDAKNKQFELAAVISKLYKSLHQLYTSPISREEKLQFRQVIFKADLAAVKAKYKNLTILSSINNAEIMQLKLYLTGFPEFDRLWLRMNKNFSLMLQTLEKNKSKLAESKEPFSLLDGIALEEKK